MNIELKAGADDEGRRLDRVLRKALPDYSLSLLHRLLRQGKVRLGGKKAGAETRVRQDDVIQVVLPNEAQNGPKGTPSPSPLRASGKPALPPILWRGSGIIVFNKPAGLASHGDDSLNTQVNDWLAGTLPPSLSFKPGPLHRLDKPTSGIIVFSETLPGAQVFTRLLRERKIKKTYLAIVEGKISGEHMWQDELVRDASVKKTFVKKGTGAGSVAVTHVRAIATNGTYTLIEADIATGRTHQIRSQCAAHGHPLAGDTKYGGKRLPGGFYLHAWKLEFTERPSGYPQMLIAPLPKTFLKFMESEQLAMSSVVVSN